MANFKNSNYYRITAKQTLPASANGTGTISTLGQSVIGVGTAFKSEMPVGSWLTSLTANEIRKVVSVSSDTEALLSDAFTVDIAALTAPNIIHGRDCNVKAISVAIKAGLADGEIDGLALANGTGHTWSKDGNSMKANGDYVDPIIVNGTGTVIQSSTLF